MYNTYFWLSFGGEKLTDPNILISDIGISSQGVLEFIEEIKALQFTITYKISGWRLDDRLDDRLKRLLNIDANKEYLSSRLQW